MVHSHKKSRQRGMALKSFALRRASGGRLMFLNATAVRLGVEVRALLSTEAVEEVDGWMAVTDVDATGQRCVKFWMDDTRDPQLKTRKRSKWSMSMMMSYHLERHWLALPVFGARLTWSRETPDRRERLTRKCDHGLNTAKISGSPGFGNRLSLPEDTANSFANRGG